MTNKYPSREIEISHPSFQMLAEDGVQIGFDKDYRFSGHDLKANAGRTQSAVRMNKEPNGMWKITAKFDTKICWSTLMSDPAMQSPPGTCPAH
jgi:hypothetical protein